MRPTNVSQELQRIARDFRRLSRRFHDYARRSRKVSHLDVNVCASAVQAGRLLVAAIDGGAFPKSSRKKNAEWWDRREGRVPGGPVAVLGSLRWKKGEPSPEQAPEYLATAAGLLDAKQLALCWTFAVGSWLVRAFPDRFREGAASWDWTHILTDDEGHAIGTNGKRLVGRWYKNGKPLPRNFKGPRRGAVGRYGWRLKGQLVRREELYDEADWLERLRIRAEVYCDACLVLSELIGPETASGVFAVSDGQLKLMIRQQVKAEAKTGLTDDIFVAAYRQHSSVRKAAVFLSHQTGRNVSKDRVHRALKRSGGIQAVLNAEDSNSIQRTVASQRRDRQRKFASPTQPPDIE